MPDPELIVDRNELESFLPTLGCEVTEDGYIRDTDTENIVTTEDGEELTIDEIGYLMPDDDDPNTVTAIRDNFSDIVGSLSDRDIRE